MILAIAGINAQDKLHQTSLAIPGTESAKTEALLHQYFGESAPFVILLRGPQGEVNAQGQQLVRVLERNPSVRTISPWSRETIGQLQPSPHTAVIFVDFRVDLDEAVKETVPHLNEILSHHIRPPVRAIENGYATVFRAIQDESVSATHRGELIAAPLLLIVLLLVFRSPIAAAIPLVFGAATVIGARGILSIAANWLSIDAFALTVTTMMGLALGVDYALLMVSRFREELAAGGTSFSAAQATRRTAGRTIAFAGGALLVSMTSATLILPGTFLVSLAGGVVIVTAFSLLLGVLVVPALLSLVGSRIDRWSIGTANRGRGRVLGVVDGLLRRPSIAALLVIVPLIVLALSSLSLAVGPPSYDQLPRDNPARLNAELVEKEIGAGWASPYVVLAATTNGAITSRRDLAVLNHWQQTFSEDSGVQAVIGPGAIARRVEPVDRFGRNFLAQDRPGSQIAKLQQLGSHLDLAATGVATLRRGISRATYGADLLSEGSGNVERGSQTVATGLTAAAEGSDRAATALAHFASGAHEIRNGQRRAALGALALKFDIRDLIPRLRHSTLIPSHKLQQELTGMHSNLPQLESHVEDADKQLSAALLEFQKMSEVPNDPHYSSALSAVRAAQKVIAGKTTASNGEIEAEGSGLSAELQDLGVNVLRATERAGQVTSGVVGRRGELEEAANLSARLVDGLNQLERGGQSLDSGARQLARATSALADGLPRLSNGATALSEGTGKLTLGTSALASHLGHAYTLSRPLELGLHKAAAESTSGGTSLQRQSDQLRRLSPGIFSSGYFNLSALDGTPPSVRSGVERLVDLNSGGQAARILVIPKYRSHTPGSVALDNRLRASAQQLGKRINGTAGVAGGTAEFNDYTRTSKSRLPLVIAVVSLMTFLSLVIILRALLVPALTVLLNLLSVAVAFGVLALVSGLPSGSPIGNWEYVDTIGAIAIFAIAFGLSIDYSVFILVRIREDFDRDGDHAAAVRFGVQRTGRVITGAAVIMVAVFAAFATANLTIVSQLGIGLTVAILVDATIIRLVLLPAVLLLMGERCWWLPVPLDRLISKLHLT